MGFGLDLDESVPLPTTASSRLSPQKEQIPEKLQRLVRQQLSDGSFEPSAQLWNLIGLSSAKVSESMTSAKQVLGCELSLKTWATALTVAYFQVSLKSFQDEWDLVVMKAVGWLSKQIASTKEIIEVAQKVIR
jgi:hypothetical protein